VGWAGIAVGWAGIAVGLAGASVVFLLVQAASAVPATARALAFKNSRRVILRFNSIFLTPFVGSFFAHR
jgi:hypothetical protein